MKTILLIVTALLRVNVVNAETFQRFEIVGSNAGGTRLAIVASHFGPSSYAPFVELRIYEAGLRQHRILSSLSQIRGDEKSIREMKQSLLKENVDQLKELEISESFDSFPLNLMTTTAGAQTLVEFDDYENGEIQRIDFSLYEEAGSSCSSPKNLNSKVRICKLSSPVVCFEPVMEDFLRCNSQRLRFSRGVKVNKTNWFFFFMQTEPMPALFFFPQMAIGGI